MKICLAAPFITHNLIAGMVQFLGGGVKIQTDEKMKVCLAAPLVNHSLLCTGGG